jgi:hypothetical protein
MRFSNLPETCGECPQFWTTNLHVRHPVLTFCLLAWDRIFPCAPLGWDTPMFMIGSVSDSNNFMLLSFDWRIIVTPRGLFPVGLIASGTQSSPTQMLEITIGLFVSEGGCDLN